MDWSFSEKLIVVSCRFIGIVFFETNYRPGNNNRRWITLIPIFYYAFSFYCIISTLLTYHQVYAGTDAESLIRASDFVGVVIIGLSLLGKGCYYFIKRKELADLVWKIKHLDGNKHHANLLGPFTLFFMMLVMSAIDITTMLRLGKNKWPMLKFILCYTMSIYESFIELMFMSIFLQALINSYKQLNENISKVSFCGRSASNSAAVKAMEGLTVKHYELCSLAMEANKIFGFPGLLGITNDFQCITGSLYVLWTTAKGNLGEESITLAIGWSAVYSLHTWCLLKDWVKLYKEASKGASYTHDIWNHYVSHTEENEEIRHLQLSAVQYYFTKPIFTACGFFPLDMTFIHLMVASVTTYWIFLTQFHTPLRI